jgi:DME family drug/metabolite transporter
MNRNPILGVMLVLGAAALWGTTGTAQSLADGSLSAHWFGALRLATASAFFACCMVASGQATRAPAAGTLATRDVLGAGLCMAVYNLAFFAGIGTVGVALGTALALGSGPIWAGLLQAALHGHRPTAAWWAGTVVAAAGGVLMTLGGARDAAGAGAGGILLCLLSGLSYAAYTLLNQRMARVAAASTITFRAFSVAAAVALPAAWLAGGTPVFTGADLAAVAYTGVVTAGLPYLLFSHALRHITPATGVTLALCEPVVAFGLSVGVLGERPSALAYLGLLLVVCGVLGVVRQELAGHRHCVGADVVLTGVTRASKAPRVIGMARRCQLTTSAGKPRNRYGAAARRFRRFGASNDIDDS